MERFFDNLSLTHYCGPLLEETHYYPFGLTMTGISDKALKGRHPENKFKFDGGVELQNKEFSDGSGLELYETTFRGYDPQIGRFWQLDPLADISEDLSLYQFANNNPILLNDPFGLISDSSHPQSLAPVTVTPKKGVHLANTRGHLNEITAGPPPLYKMFIMKEELTHERSEMRRRLWGYDPEDPVDAMEHRVVRTPSFWERLTYCRAGHALKGYNIFGEEITEKYYGGIAPIDGSFRKIQGFTKLFSLRDARTWEELFEWGHNLDVLKKIATVSGEDIVRLKNAGVTLEELELWSKSYGEAIFKSSKVTNLVAKYRQEYINKLIELW